MQPLFVKSIGAFTSVGNDVPLTMASLLNGVQMFDDLAIDGLDGEPVTGAAAPIDRALRGTQRLAALAFLALEQCEINTSTAGLLPIFVCGPRAPDDVDAGATLLDEMLADLPFDVDRQESRVVLRGRGGIREGLDWVRDQIYRKRAPHCCLVGVDSLIERDRVLQLIDEGRLCGPDSPDGLIPGEGAGAIVFSARAKGALAALAAISFADDRNPASAGAGAVPHGLPEAIDRALAAAVLAATDVVAVAYDAAPTPESLDEFALATSQPPLDRLPEVRFFVPSTSTGEVGAASAILTLAMLAFFVDKKVFTGQALACLTTETDARAAVIVGPPPQREAT